MHVAPIAGSVGGELVDLERRAAFRARSPCRVEAAEAEQAKQRFDALGITNAIARQADGSNGLPGEGPFDRIVAWVAFESLPRFLLDQLSSGGVVIAPIGSEESEQVLAKLTKVGSRFEREDIGTVRLQPVLPGLAAVL